MAGPRAQCLFRVKGSRAALFPARQVHPGQQTRWPTAGTAGSCHEVTYVAQRATWPILPMLSAEAAFRVEDWLLLSSLYCWQIPKPRLRRA